MESQPWLLLISAAALGFRHGIDWDHIAAISDIVGTASPSHSPSPSPFPSPSPSASPSASHCKKAGSLMQSLPLRLSSFYAMGHATVVAALGLCALYFAAVLPAWVDPIMEKLVGCTLLLLAVFVCISLVRHSQGKEDFRLRSRWMLAFSLFEKVWTRVRSRITGKPADRAPAVRDYGNKTAFGIGMIHGFGAETGTQVLLIAALGGAAGHGLGPQILAAFLGGLVASNTLLAIIGTSGFISAKRNHFLYLSAGALTCCFSLVIGTYFALGRGEQLPDLGLRRRLNHSHGKACRSDLGR